MTKATEFIDRFREIVLDPLNLLIERVPQAGLRTVDGHVVLHNGNRVKHRGPLSYYDDFSDVLVLNRGVHEPLEEFCFQEFLRLNQTPEPVMVELGAYWGHYSMWMKKKKLRVRTCLVDELAENLESAMYNFAQNGLSGEFRVERIASDARRLGQLLDIWGIDALDLLHSDIQGAEVDLLRDEADLLGSGRVGTIFLSTHSNPIHAECSEILESRGYRIEVSSDFDTHSTSYDGFILATNRKKPPLLPGFVSLGLNGIVDAPPERLLEYVTHVHALRRSWSL